MNSKIRLGIWLVGFWLLGLSGAQAQRQFRSYNGGVHTPKGRLHMLVIFVRYTDKSMMGSHKAWPDSDSLPLMARGESNELFYADPQPMLDGERKFNISDFYYTASNGKFLITADVFPVQVPVKFIPKTRSNFFPRQSKMNAAAMDWIALNYPNFDWSKYDNRTNRPRYQYDNSTSEPDSILDYVVFLHRAGGGQTGMGACGSANIKDTPYKLADGYTGILCRSDAKPNWTYFKHEFSHNLYDAPHYMGANSTDGSRFYVQNGWGMMSQEQLQFYTANAWEKWWLDWIEPQTITRSGRYRIKDCVTKGDAIRIQIPGTRQYLWIENHQKIDQWDTRLYYEPKEDPAYPVVPTGIYMYVVAENGASRSKGLRTFSASHCNMMKLLNGDGYWDFEPTKDSAQTKYFKSIALRRLRENPIAGQNDLQFIRADYNGDGVIKIGYIHGNGDGRHGEGAEVWVEHKGGTPKATYNLFADEGDAFVTGDEVSLSGTLPVLNYPSYLRNKQQLQPFLLNGIRIKIGPKDASGTYSLDVSFSDWTIRKDKRWCGNMIVQADTINRKPYLEIAENVNLLLDLSGTPDRTKPHPDTKTFTNPTRLTIEKGRGLRLRKNSSLTVSEFSELTFLGNSKLILEPGSKLIIKTSGKLVLKDQSQIVIRGNAELIIANDGFVEW